MSPADDAATYRRWFPLADTDDDGRVTGQDAVSFFARAGLEKDALARAWQLADANRQGFLGPDEFVRALRVIALAQSGVAVSDITSASLDAAVADGTLTHLAELEGVDADAADAANNPFDASGPRAFSSRVSRPRGRRAQRFAQREAGHLDRGLLKSCGPVPPRSRPGPLLPATTRPPEANNGLLPGRATRARRRRHASSQKEHEGPSAPSRRTVSSSFSTAPSRGGRRGRRAVQTDKPFTGLGAFGGGFLGRFEGAQCANELLGQVSFVDTPGVLSGEKQRVERAYNFIGVCEWFAYRCDLILLLFDPYKLDISDEFKNVISTLKGHDDKVRVVLNKSDQVSAQQLLRVYGAPMWSLGGVHDPGGGKVRWASTPSPRARATTA